MQIKSIVLYGRNGKRRELKFNLGTTNIITGKSGTGKSVLISIVDYCMGSETCDIAEGPIRDHVAWYGLLLQFEKGQVFIARKDPGDQSVSTLCYLLERDRISLPASIEANTNVDGIKLALSGRLGIAPNYHVPPDHSSRSPVSATVRHILPLSFQEQDEIATRKQLFHRPKEEAGFFNQHFKDTLPYFLGVVRDNELAIEQRIRLLKRELFLLEREYKNKIEVQGSANNKALQFISEAREVGLVPKDFNESLDKPEPTIAFLRTLLDWTPSETTLPDQSQNLGGLIKRKETLDTEIYKLNRNRDAAEVRAGVLVEHAEVVGDQLARLESIGLYPEKFDYQHCPLCSAELPHHLPTAAQLNKAVHTLQQTVTRAGRTRPQVRKYINDLQSQIESLQLELQTIKTQIESIYNVNQIAARIRDENNRKSRVIGRISLWLDELDKTRQKDDLKDKIDQVKKTLKTLEKKVDPDEKQQLMGVIFGRMSTKMTAWAKVLQLEHASNSSIRFDLSRMTIVVDRPNKSVALSQIGSGQNWLGYHLISHFALHDYFVEHQRPTPRFLFLDQPTQVYFPPDQDKKDRIKDSGNLSDIKDEDQLAVDRMFKFIFDTVESLHGKFQVILTDHANLKDNPRFQKAILEEWREGRALIPSDWLT